MLRPHKVRRWMLSNLFLYVAPQDIQGAGQPSQSGDPVRGFLENGFDMAVKLRPSVHFHSQYLDILLKWKRRAANRQLACHCCHGGW
ncbi:hypothetical protein E2C01_079060 [Portunus trituberculatus]|uniref:Uncharacterized protein n=1 Tax=Portunus trituberculatus TaxID=210409 RepID=A0A5B7IKG8_PORTR|nr:hypothetical protein [Portunus trituberculatus]